MTKQRLPIGKSDFSMVIEDNCYYIDKTFFIKEITEASADVLLFPRPRRFGKTLNLSMLRYFYEKSETDQSRLFEGLTIFSEEVFEKHQGKYPVIFLTFKDIKENSWESMYQHIINILRDEFLRHDLLLKSDMLSRTEKEYYESVLTRKAGYADYADSLRYLSIYLERCHNKRVIILIDEYDTPIHTGYIHGFYEEVIRFMRNFLSGGLKDNRHLFKGVLTGILRVAKESVFSGLNNLCVYSLLSQRFSEVFGFTESEITRILQDYDMTELHEELSHWYNGYQFGRSVIYNPWSVLNYIDNKGEKAPYWINTASTEMIERLATHGGRELREELGTLLEGNTITKPIYENIVMKDLDTKDELLWSFLLFSGYLKATEQTDYEIWQLEIPNYEVRLIYERLVRAWFEEKIETNRLEDMLKALENGDVKRFEQLLQVIIIQVMSWHDFRGEPEKVYHALVLGMMVWLSNKYEIRSNRESGLGRYDLMLKPNDLNKQGIIIEFKKTEPNEKPRTVLKKAMEQIKSMKYETELEAAGVRNILKIAVAFQGKEVSILSE